MHNHLTASDTIAAQVRRHRTRLGMSREQLAAECERLGATGLTYAALVSIESGRRKPDGSRRREVTADELLTLGLALAVPPLLLMLPLGSEQTVPTVPNRDPRDPYTVWKWWTGEETPTLGGPVDGRHFPETQPIGENGPKWSRAWAESAYPASLYPEFERRRQAAHKAHLRADATFAKRRTDKEGHTAAETDYVHRLEELAMHINEMQQAGLTIPALRPAWIEYMQGLDMLDDPDSIHPKGTE
ncbi:helix-turn-helix transcriptional regulator [Streptomyces sp. NPDC050844]|uniref:helix-turn-helix domain-containing protein n=1 Tax=Streptomyces sp. NPDC050844 TaxID=3155790 RepID=UPI0033C7DE1B